MLSYLCIHIPHQVEQITHHLKQVHALRSDPVFRCDQPLAFPGHAFAQALDPLLHISTHGGVVLIFTHSDAIKRIVENSGSLRDRSLFALLETGLRGHVILGTKVSQVFSLKTQMPSSKEISIEITKAKPPLTLANTAVIEKYIREENLSADDYLFPSDDRKQPMSTSQLLRIFQSWERGAQLPRSTLTPSTLRRAAMAQLAASTPPQQPGKRIAGQLGHSSSSMAEHYVSLTTTGADAALKTAK